MSKAGRLLFNRKRTSSATFHVDEDFSAGWRRRHEPVRMGYGRTVFSAVSLTLGLGLAYVALHYVPAFVSPAQVVRISDLDERSLKADTDGLAGTLAPLWTSLQTRRSYIWEGESIEVQYTLPANTEVDLVVERCARQIVREVFACTPVSQQVVTVRGPRGQERLYFGEPGFYRFRESGSVDARVIWRRV